MKIRARPLRKTASPSNHAKVRRAISSRRTKVVQRGLHRVMDHMMGGAMMWGMGLIGLLVILVLILAVAALVKYLFLSNRR
jgi:hypothetical protein